MNNNKKAKRMTLSQSYSLSSTLMGWTVAGWLWDRPATSSNWPGWASTWRKATPARTTISPFLTTPQFQGLVSGLSGSLSFQHINILTNLVEMPAFKVVLWVSTVATPTHQTWPAQKICSLCSLRGQFKRPMGVEKCVWNATYAMKKGQCV